MKTRIIERQALCGINVVLNIFDCLAVKELVHSYEERQRLKAAYDEANDALYKAKCSPRDEDEDRAILETAQVTFNKARKDYYKCTFNEQDALETAITALNNLVKALPSDFEGATIFDKD